MIKNFVVVILCAAFVFSISSCGVRGDLYRAEQQK